jgi:hypothetical protein
MLKIENLSVSKELDRAEMGAIVGGNAAAFGGIDTNYNGGLSFASPQTIVNPVVALDASTHTNVDVKSITKSIDAVGSLLNGVRG